MTPNIDPPPLLYTLEKPTSVTPVKTKNTPSIYSTFNFRPRNVTLKNATIITAEPLSIWNTPADVKSNPKFDRVDSSKSNTAGSEYIAVALSSTLYIPINAQGISQHISPRNISPD